MDMKVLFCFVFHQWRKLLCEGLCWGHIGAVTDLYPFSPWIQSCRSSGRHGSSALSPTEKATFSWLSGSFHLVAMKSSSFEWQICHSVPHCGAWGEWVNLSRDTGSSVSFVTITFKKGGPSPPFSQFPFSAASEPLWEGQRWSSQIASGLSLALEVSPSPSALPLARLQVCWGDFVHLRLQKTNRSHQWVGSAGARLKWFHFFLLFIILIWWTW